LRENLGHPRWSGAGSRIFRNTSNARDHNFPRPAKVFRQATA
jgi:hypothetical protein